MALGTGAISLQDVANEISGVQTSLNDCFTDAAGTFNGTYARAGVQALSEFRGYEDITVSITPASTSVGCAAGGVLITVDVEPAGATWTTSDNAAWITLTSSGGTGDGSFTANYTNNCGGSTRVGTVTVTAGGASDTTIITQSPV